MANPRKKVLGRGLDALIPTATPAPTPAPSDRSTIEISDDQRILQLDPQQIDPNPKQPRRVFAEEQLEELAASIRNDGVQEPVIVRKTGDRYELVSGERRVRAAIVAGLKTIPAIRRDVDDVDMLRLGLVENIQREDLNAIEEAQAYQTLVEELGWTQNEVAEQVGKKRATVTNTLRLLNLPKDVQARVADGSISMGHARALLAFESPGAQRTVCRKIIEQGLSVRQVEKLATPKPPKKTVTQTKDPNIEHVEDELRKRLGTKVLLKPKGPQSGAIEIEYYSLDDLDRILDMLRP